MKTTKYRSVEQLLLLLLLVTFPLSVLAQISSTHFGNSQQLSSNQAYRSQSITQPIVIPCEHDDEQLISATAELEIELYVFSVSVDSLNHYTIDQFVEQCRQRDTSDALHQAESEALERCAASKDSFKLYLLGQSCEEPCSRYVSGTKCMLVDDDLRGPASSSARLIIEPLHLPMRIGGRIVYQHQGYIATCVANAYAFAEGQAFYGCEAGTD